VQLLRFGAHYMSKYQPQTHNQLMESINSEREPLLERQVQWRKFEADEGRCSRTPRAIDCPRYR
jgi:pyruvate-formate lyase-activating enzyme